MATHMHLLLALLILPMAHHSRASFCVCKTGLQSASYQQAIDYACGHGADCSAIGPSGQCYNPNSIQNHCSFATNSYYQKNAGKGATCDFQQAAVLTNSDPSGGGCSFSAGSGSSGGSTSTGTTSPVTTVPTTSPTTTPVTGGGSTMPVTPVSGSGTPISGTTTGTPISGTGSPYATTPNTSNPTSTGVLGGGNGLAPTGSSMDDNDGNKLKNLTFWSFLVVLVISGFTCM